MSKEQSDKRGADGRYPYAEHDNGIVLTQPRAGEFELRPMTPAELAAREPALKIAKDVYRHANQAGVCYYEFWRLIADAIEAFTPSHVAHSEVSTFVAWDVEAVKQEIRDLFARYGSGNYTPTQNEIEIIDTGLDEILTLPPSAPSTTPLSEATPRTDAVMDSITVAAHSEWSALEELARQLERELAEVRGAFRRSDAENDELRQENGALSTASAMGTLTERERVVLGNLIHLADAVHHALDDSEEIEDKSINVTEEHYNMLCLAVACLDDLPDDKPGYIMCPAAKAQWALRRIMGEQENNAADGGKA